MAWEPLRLSVSESEHTLGWRSRSLERSCPRRFEYRVRNFQLTDDPDCLEPILRALTRLPTIDTLLPDGLDGEERDILNVSWGHRYMEE